MSSRRQRISQSAQEIAPISAPVVIDMAPMPEKKVRKPRAKKAENTSDAGVEKPKRILSDKQKEALAKGRAKMAEKRLEKLASK